MTKRIVQLLLVLVVLQLAYAQSRSAIVGTITDSEGAVLANARIMIHWDPAGSNVGLTDNVGIKSDILVLTDKEGHYSADVPAGFYDVFVSRSAFTPTAAKVRVKTGRATTYNSTLRSDSVVSRELD